MPIYQALAIFGAAVLITSIAAAFAKRLKIDLLEPAFWLTVFAVAGTLSAASAMVEKTRHAGTGLTTSHGWPKAFYFRYLTETGSRSGGWEFIYFAGNFLIFAGCLLIIWAIWRVARR